MSKKIIAAGGIIFNDERQLLMIYRRKKWDLPKGKLDNDEKIEACALREVKEETGLEEVTIKHFAGLTYHDYYDKYSKKDVIKETHWYEMHAPGMQPLVPQQEEDIELIEWVDEEHIADKLEDSYPNIVQIIQQLMNDK